MYISMGIVVCLSSLSTLTLGQSASGQAVCVGEHAEDGRPQCAVILTAYAAHHPGGSGEMHSNNLQVHVQTYTRTFTCNHLARQSINRYNVHEVRPPETTFEPAHAVLCQLAEVLN